MQGRSFLFLTFIVTAIFLQSCSSLPEATPCRTRPEGFVSVKSVIPDIQSEMRYAGSNNFIGRPIDGYERPVPILTREAAGELKKVQDDLRPCGLSLKIYDAYRPQRAVDNFYRWAGDSKDQKNKMKYYPDINKRFLFKEGYITNKSSHSRGSTVDLTITCMMKDGTFTELDMGSGFDLFSTKSWPDSREVTAQQRTNRLFLRELMIKHGFVPYSKEWWHFMLADEPWPKTYFDFPVR